MTKIDYVATAELWSTLFNHPVNSKHVELALKCVQKERKTTIPTFIPAETGVAAFLEGKECVTMDEVAVFLGHKSKSYRMATMRRIAAALKAEGWKSTVRDKQKCWVKRYNWRDALGGNDGDRDGDGDD